MKRHSEEWHKTELQASWKLSSNVGGLEQQSLPQGVNAGQRGSAWQAILFGWEPKKKMYIMTEKAAEMENMEGLSKPRIINCFP